MNDLGATPGINNPKGPAQAAYAWYAFDTTNGRCCFRQTHWSEEREFLKETLRALELRSCEGYDRGVTGDDFGVICYSSIPTVHCLAPAELKVKWSGCPCFQSMPDIYIDPENIAGPPVAPPPAPGANDVGARFAPSNPRRRNYADSDEFRNCGGVRTKDSETDFIATLTVATRCQRSEHLCSQTNRLRSSQNGYAEGSVAKPQL